jgi:hypothetical protein
LEQLVKLEKIAESKKESLTRKLTEVVGRMSSSKARHAQVIPRSKV